VPGADAQLAEARVVRTIVVVLGVGVTIYAALSAQTVIAQTRYVDSAWTVYAAATVFGVPAVLAALSPFLSLRVMRIVLGVYSVAFMTVVATWVPAMTGSPMPFEIAPWPLGITGIGTLPAALAWRPALAWATIVANGGLLAVVRYLAAGEVDPAVSLQDGLFAIAFSAIFTVVAVVIIRNAQALDAAAVTARARAASAASVAARLQEQARLDALVHDELITALYYATTDRGELTGSVRMQATRALDELARLDTGRDDGTPVEPAEFASRLRSALLELASGLAITILSRRTTPVPADVADAFAEGATEALRNSLRHAGGPDVPRRAVVTANDERIMVEIRDNGIGFDPGSVNPYRLGILVSIRGRLEAVDRGSARVVSAPGRGTVVTLEWRDR
jgi:signal transduction histidine kinase